MKQKFILLFIVLLCLSVGSYAQSDSLCYGHTSTAPSCADSFVTNYPGGSWASSDTAVAVVNPETGEVTPVSGGTTDIEYTFANGCGKYHYSYTVTIIKPTLTGTDSICVGSATTFVASPSGGTWVSGNTAIATVGSTGVVTGVAAGSAIVTYTSPQGCQSIKAVYVSAPFSVAICETAPIAMCDSVVTYCTGLTLKVSGAPAGAAYSWSGSIPATLSYDGSDAVFTFTASPTAGYYTVTATYGGCSATQRIRILVATGSCEPCSAFKPACSGCDTVLPFTTLRTSTLTSANVSTTTPQNYFIASPGGNVRLNVSPAPGSVFYIDKSVQMFVAVGDSVVLDSCHLFATTSCQWYGIDVNVTSSGSAKLYIKNNTLIENVGTSTGGAISVHCNGYGKRTGDGNSVPLYGSNIIDANGLICNNDFVGVHIYTYTTTTQPFRIVNSVFTNRDFCAYRNYSTAGCRSYYPYSWPTSQYLKQVDSIGYYPRYRVDSFAYITSSAVGYAVQLEYVGTVNTTTTPHTFSHFKFGDTTSAVLTNLVDRYARSNYAGFKSFYSDAQVYNSVFRMCYDGFFNDQSSSGEYSAEIIGTVDTTRTNRFYNCQEGVKNTCTGRFKCNNNYFSNTNTVSGFSSAFYGVYDKLPTTFSYTMDSIDINDNVIRNVQNGVKLDASSTTNCMGVIRAMRNRIYGISSTSGTEVADIGIFFLHGSSCDSGEAYVTDNIIEGQRTNGIQLSSNFAAYVEDNTVVLKNSTVNAITQTRGIFISRGVGTTARWNKKLKTIQHNHVYGDTVYGVTYRNPEVAPNASALGLLDGAAGIIVEKAGSIGDTAQITCNYIHDMGIGVMLLDTSIIELSNNVMSRLSRGIALLKAQRGSTPPLINAIINNQGSSTSPSDNVWDSASTGWPGWGAYSGTDSMICQTFVGGEDTTINTAKIYVRAGSEYTPTQNGSAPVYDTVPAQPFDTSLGNIVVVSSGASPNECAPVYYSEVESRSASSSLSSESIQSGSANSYRLYPNPNDGRFTVQRTETTDEAVMAEVVNMTGQKVFEGSLNFRKGQASLDMQKRASGVYLLRMVKSKGAVETLRFVVD